LKMDEVHEDPTNRYLRREFSHRVGRTSVYKCLDQEEGITADWNEIDITGVTSNRIHSFSTVLTNYTKIASHDHLVKIYRAWVDQQRNTLFYITEIYSQKTLRHYVQEVAHRPAKNVISKWVVQIITGLGLLHHCQPPIIHNNLSCGTIFIDASEGALKLFVPSIESILFGSDSAFTDEKGLNSLGNPKSDIWSLGLCVIEIATGAELNKGNSNDISKQELSGALGQVSDPSVADFITTCLLPVAQRPSVENLFESTLLQDCYIPPVEEPKQEVSHPDPLEELRAKQKLEKEHLLQKQKEERKALREMLRAKNKKPASMRDLLKESE
jgi:WNK lysine deficient protein kinase